MKRDLDLIRSILLYIESVDDHKISHHTIAEALGRDPDEINFHLTLLADCRYINMMRTTPDHTLKTKYFVNRITSSGYDYLDNVRDNKVYIEAKLRLKQVASYSLDVLKQVAAEVIISLIKV